MSKSKKTVGVDPAKGEDKTVEVLVRLPQEPKMENVEIVERVRENTWILKYNTSKGEVEALKVTLSLIRGFHGLDIVVWSNRTPGFVDEYVRKELTSEKDAQLFCNQLTYLEQESLEAEIATENLSDYGIEEWYVNRCSYIRGIIKHLTIFKRGTLALDESQTSSESNSKKEMPDPKAEAVPQLTKDDVEHYIKDYLKEHLKVKTSKFVGNNGPQVYTAIQLDGKTIASDSFNL